MDAKQFTEALVGTDETFLCDFAEMLDSTKDFKKHFVNAMLELDRCPRCGKELKIIKLRESHGEWLIHAFCPTHKEDFI